MTQEPERKKRAPGNEGASYTAEIMAEVKRRRQAKDWSAGRLAEEMVKVGVPWTRDLVVNLENGRRKRLAVHELMALAFVLDAETPVDLLTPPESRHGKPVLVVPGVFTDHTTLRAWCMGKTGPLRSLIEALASGPETAELRAGFLDLLGPFMQKFGAPDGGVEALVEDLTRTVISHNIGEAIEAAEAAEAQARGLDGAGQEGGS